jgi:ribosomal protein S18 acetylase RimI-like enzyme
MATGPFADLAQHLIAFDSDEAPVAVTSVWAAGPGRPGLIEPMGVHKDHHGRGYGVAITLAGARALQQEGSSSAVVVAEGSNDGALATYVAAGFVPSTPVTDLSRA